MSVVEKTDSKEKKPKWSIVKLPPNDQYPKYDFGIFCIDNNKVLLYGGMDKNDTNKCWIWEVDSDKVESAADLP